MDIKENLKLVAKAGFNVIRSILVVVGLGITANWVFAVISFFAIKPLSVPIIGILVLCFMVGMPIGYFLIGKTYGIRKGLAYLLKEKKIVFFEYIIDKILASSKEKILSYQALQNTLNNSQTWLNQLPKPVRLLANFLLAKIPFNEALLEVAKNQNISTTNLGNISEILAKKLDEKTEISLIAPDSKPLWILACVNIILMILVYAL
ncbi:MAG: hypothetical protein MUE81_11300 [Thermoflexibacter sp.]|jgi:hypothetical protein|nr:hypothetical protein [Thermoflexibacter sp.]